MNIRRLVLLAVTASGLSACSEPFAPTALHGNFEQRDFAQFRSASDVHLFEGVSKRLEIDRDRAVLITRVLVTDLATLERHVEELRFEMTYRISGARLVTAHVPEGMNLALPDSPDFMIRDENALFELGRHGGGVFQRVFSF